jgi:heme/copper-type cytochrome/quinol oxidase subunit 3
MGLMYLLQYVAAWVHYFTNYEQAKDSYLSHFIAINGMHGVLGRALLSCGGFSR